MVEDRGLVLVIDIDDFIVKSSPELQKVVNAKTNFKTDVLNMFEQLIRNCSYLVDEVSEECKNAKDEGRKPDLKRFLIFDEFVEGTDEDITDRVIAAAEYYRRVAIELKEQFLEERDTFLEIDNMKKGMRKYFEYEKEMAKIIELANKVHNNKDAFHKINKFCLSEFERIVKDAKDNNKIPSYGALVSMDSNDVIKGSSVGDDASVEELYFNLPRKNLENCIKNEPRIIDIVTNADVFFKKSEEIVDYSKIHTEVNVDMKSVSFINRLIDSKKFKYGAFGTHHNGDREDGDKRSLMSRILPRVKEFVGLRFHDVEHNVIRRGRSSKITKVAHKLHILPEDVVLLDDSIANCRDCQKNGGLAILYKPMTDSEKINGRLEDTGFVRITDFSEESYRIVMEAVDKHLAKLENNKIKIKK